jgi:hypothetical protein
MCCLTQNQYNLPPVSDGGLQEVVASSETGLSEMAKLLEGQERRTFNLGEVPWWDLVGL